MGQRAPLILACSLIAVESLNIKGMLRNGRLARAISDVAWGGFLRVLQGKAEKAGVRFMAVDPRGTSQECVCGQEVRKSLSDRGMIAVLAGCRCLGIKSPRK
jgi:putative transposase